jgi:hypothetical protein
MSDRVLPCHYVQLQLRLVFGCPPKRGLVFRISKLSKTEGKCALWLCTLRIAQISQTVTKCRHFAYCRFNNFGATNREVAAAGRHPDYQFAGVALKRTAEWH